MFLSKNKKTKALLIGLSLAISTSFVVAGCGNKQQQAQMQGAQVKAMQARLFVPSHAEVCDSIADLAQFNMDKVLEIADRIVDICKEPQCFESVLQKLFDGYALSMNYEQYVLVGSTVRSYLAWLKDQGALDARFEDSRMLWETK